MQGIRKCALDAVYRAQGKGCPPYTVGVAAGGLADETIALSKKQLLRDLSDKNPDKRLAALERRLLADINCLGIGPMGLGGQTTAIAVKCGKQHRHIASYFVAVSFACWALRKKTIEVTV